MTYDVAIVGTGPNPEDPDTDGFAMGYRHAAAYDRLDDCRLVACADIVRPNAEQFAEQFGIPFSNVYEDYQRMLREVGPDLVSVCVPPAIHADIVIGCAESDTVEAIHCEKPMATTWEDCKEMVRVCEERDVQLTFNHQRRFGKPFTTAKELLDEGNIGSLVRIEVGGVNLYDYGTHHFDLCGYYTDQASAEWMLAQINYTEENVQFGAHNENQALAQWRYDNGVYGLASTGDGSMLECQMRLVGTDGVVEIGTENGPALRIRTGSGNWKSVDTDGDTVHGPTNGLLRTGARKVLERLPRVPADRLLRERPAFVERAVADVVAALESDEPSPLSATNALQSTELVFAAWESARRRGRVDLPLDVGDNPLEAMVASGDIEVAPADD